MTLKYESEILFDLMKRDGDDTPSDVLPYESELKEKYLNQVVGAYPKLQDYRPEWLSYNLYHHIPSNFPIESVTNVTNASFHDVVPYAYKSAILKGQTKYRDEDGDVHDSFVQIPNEGNLYKGTRDFNPAYWERVGEKPLEPFELDPNFKQATLISNYMVLTTSTLLQGFMFDDPNKTWTISAMFKGTQEGQTIGITLDADRLGYDKKPVTNGQWTRITWTFQGLGTLQKFRFENDSLRGEIKVAQIMVTETDHAVDWKPALQDGEYKSLELISCKMPVLTPTGKNLFNKDSAKTHKGLTWAHGDEHNSTNSVTSDFIYNSSNTYSTNYYARVFCYDSNKEYIGALNGKDAIAPTTGGSFKSFEIPNNVTYFRLWFQQTANTDVILVEKLDEIQLEGMTSGQMPVLTTTGKNLFNGELELGTISNTTGENAVNNSWKRTVNYLKVDPNTKYVYSLSLKGVLLGIRYYDENKKFIIDGGTKPNFTTPTNCHYIRFTVTTTKEANIQIEKGTTATAYEPYKSNILTVNEDVTLRGIGEVKDELDCLTGELTQRIGEVVLDGSEKWDDLQPYQDFVRARIRGGIGGVKNTNGDGLLTNSTLIPHDNFPEESDHEKIGTHANGHFYILVSRNKLSDISINGIKNWLSQNPITVQYQLKKESVKTVDLSATIRPIEGTMHVSTSSQTLPPLLDMSVPVEATTQNLMSFANIEEEE